MTPAIDERRTKQQATTDEQCKEKKNTLVELSREDTHTAKGLGEAIGFNAYQMEMEWL